MSAALELLRAAQEGDQDACERAVIENNGLIWSVVRRYCGRGVDPEDLYQLGCLGFLKAVRGFDFDYGTCFSTYAVPKIAGEIRRFLRDDGAVKVGRTLREQAQTLYGIRGRLRQQLGREPVLSELAEASGLTAEEIARIEIATDTPESLQKETADGLTLEGTLGTEGCHGGADRPPGGHRPPAGEGADDHPAPVLQGADPGAGGPDPGGVPGAGIPAGAPGAETAAGVSLGLKWSGPWNSVMTSQYRLGMWVMRQRGFSRSRMAMVS